MDMRFRKRTRDKLTRLAVRFARETLESGAVPASDQETLTRFLDLPWEAGRTCPICGGPVTSHRATYCGARCRKQASRLRASTE